MRMTGVGLLLGLTGCQDGARLRGVATELGLYHVHSTEQLRARYEAGLSTGILNARLMADHQISGEAELSGVVTPSLVELDVLYRQAGLVGPSNEWSGSGTWRIYFDDREAFEHALDVELDIDGALSDISLRVYRSDSAQPRWVAEGTIDGEAVWDLTVMHVPVKG